ncbi:MAG: outer membrane lipoprotein carrier protein LolA [Longimicrobiales bacterium]|nr:outer membrane lipoprotein carrier protein LolA [Longimicrobiales bacterium]
MRTPPIVLLILAIASPHPPLTAQTDDARAVVAAAAERYADFHTLCAEFRQTLTASVLGRETRSAGELCQKRPNLFAMEFSDPAGDRIVVDGEWAWVWYRSINPETVIRIPLDPTRGGFDFYREFLENPLERYAISDGARETIEGETMVRVRLVPHTPRGYTAATVWIDPGRSLIRRVSIEEESGNRRTVTLRDIRPGVEIPEGTFTFVVPRGVQITGPGRRHGGSR